MMFCLNTALHNQKKHIKFACLPNFRRYFIKACSFFFRSVSCSSFVNCPSLMSTWLLIISSEGLSMISSRFPSEFLKCTFHFRSLSFGFEAFSLALEVLFILLTLFTVCDDNCHCLFSTKFLILLIWLWMDYWCSFWYDLVSHHHHHHVVPPAWISLTLPRHSSQSFITSGRSSGLHPVSSLSCCM